MENIKSLNKNSINKAHLIKTANENHEKSISVSLHLEPLDSCVFIPTTHGLDRFAKGAGIKGIRKTHGFFFGIYLHYTIFFFSRTVTFVECSKNTHIHHSSFKDFLFLPGKNWGNDPISLIFFKWVAQPPALFHPFFQWCHFWPANEIIFYNFSGTLTLVLARISKIGVARHHYVDFAQNMI